MEGIMIKLKQCQGDQTETAIDKARLNIGRDQTNDIVLDDEMVSGFHACVFLENNIIELVDLGSSNGTLVNGKRITGRVALKPWDKIRFGESDLEVVDPAGRRPTTIQSVPAGTKVPADHARAAIATLHPVSSAHGADIISIKKTIRVGRSDSNDVVLSDSTVSSRHAELVVIDNRIEVVDLDSTNGTWVNGKRITRERLYDGDNISFDEIAYRVSCPGSPRKNNRNLNHAAFTPGATQSDAAMSPKPAAPALDFSMPADRHVKNAARQPSPDFSFEAETSGPKLPSPGKQSYDHSRSTTAPKRDLKWLLFSIEGRLGRLNYFISALLVMFVTIILLLILETALWGGLVIDPFSPDYGGSFLANLIIYIPATWIHVALAAKRFHDQNRSAHWYWLTLIFLVNLVIICMLLFARGTQGKNRFGDELT